eukprot:scaffold24613_cov176-Cylindrotheca_fusiformis.AAC.5
MNSTEAEKSVKVPQATLLIENPKKNTNWGPLLRCCAAFGIPQIFVIGYDTCSVQGSHGASKHVELVSFPTHQQAVDTLKQHDYDLVGILGGVANADDEAGYDTEESEQSSNIDKTSTEHFVTVSSSSKGDSGGSRSKSYPVHCRPFSNYTCFVVGKRAVGLPLRLAKFCQRFVHISHQAELKNQTASENSLNCVAWLNLESCVSIVLHEFSAWAGFHSEHYQGQKYKVLRIVKGAPQNRDAKRNERKRKMEERSQEAASEGALGNLFRPEDDDGDY